MDEAHAERLLEDLLSRGLVPDERVDGVERLRDAGETWAALEYAMNGEIAGAWPARAEVA